MNYPSFFQEALDELSKLPSIGKKTASRLLFHLIKKEENYTNSLTKALINLRKNIKYCRRCYNLSDGEFCSICSNIKRNKSLICIVANITDLFAVENTQQYQGVYHVLGGLISPIEGVGPDDLQINKLLERLESEDVKELIFALSATMTGETTTYYISQKVKGKNLILSRISKGVSVGHELEYTDETTLGRSLLERVTYH